MKENSSLVKNETKQKLFLDSNIDRIDKKYIVEEKKTSNFKTIHYIVAKENRKQIKREVGDYFIINFKYEKLFSKQNLLIKEVERVIKNFLKKYNKAEKVLVVGLGNERVLGDSLGVEVTNKVIATNQYNDFLTIPKIALFNPSVTEKTGINSYNLIKMVVSDLKPDIIIMVDSFATGNEEYLNSAIEINDTGIIPGSVLNSSREINKKSFNIPILSIGVPCCLLYHKKIYNSTFIKEVITLASDVISKSLNNLFIEHH